MTGRRGRAFAIVGDTARPPPPPRTCVGASSPRAGEPPPSLLFFLDTTVRPCVCRSILSCCVSSIVEVYWFGIPCCIFLLRLVSLEKKSTRSWQRFLSYKDTYSNRSVPSWTMTRGKSLISSSLSARSTLSFHIFSWERNTRKHTRPIYSRSYPTQQERAMALRHTARALQRTAAALPPAVPAMPPG
jgi:hypothetical protein